MRVAFLSLAALIGVTCGCAPQYYDYPCGNVPREYFPSPPLPYKIYTDHSKHALMPETLDSSEQTNEPALLEPPPPALPGDLLEPPQPIPDESY